MPEAGPSIVQPPGRHSAIYTGRVRHRRFRPVPHQFRYCLFMMYLDLDELPELFRGARLWSFERRNLAWFRRGDYFGDPALPLKQAVLQLVSEKTGRRPEGPVRLLTHLRYFGYCFNPVSFYYCFDRDGKTLGAIVAEINNTPWNERRGPLRPRQRAVRAASRSEHDVFLRRIRTTRHDLGAGFVVQVGAYLRQTADQRKGPCAGNRHRLGRFRDPRGAKVRMQDHDRDHFRGSV